MKPRQYSISLPDSTSREYLSIAKFMVWQAVVQKSSRITQTALVTLGRTDLVNFIRLFTTILPFLKFRISKFWNPVRFDWRQGTSYNTCKVVSLLTKFYILFNTPKTKTNLSTFPNCILFTLFKLFINKSLNCELFES